MKTVTLVFNDMCGGCERELYRDSEGIYHNGYVYCSEECLISHMNKKANRRINASFKIELEQLGLELVVKKSVNS